MNKDRMQTALFEQYRTSTHKFKMRSVSFKVLGFEEEEDENEEENNFASRRSSMIVANKGGG